MKETLCFIGHTHDLEIMILENGRFVRRPLAQGEVISLPRTINISLIPAAWGSPDGNCQAKYVIWIL
ncbi:MAG: hypothetical protein R2874_00715 [Desulfobacterales bacterium]